MMLKKAIVLLVMVLAGIPMRGETREFRLEHRHECSIQFGDWMTETVLWRDQPHASYIGVGTAETLFKENHDYSRTPHFGLAYQYRINGWLGVGCMTDYQHVSWNRIWYNNRDQEVSRSREYFYNLCILPTVRFTYFHRPWMNLYSSISAGMVINGGSETDFYGHHTAVGMSANLNFISASFNYGQWFAAVEIGTLLGFKDSQTIYSALSRTFTLSIGYRL